MAGTLRGPVPTTSVFLSELPTSAIGDKVRFLGWYLPHDEVCLQSANGYDSVTNYSITTGLLTLEHDYPRGTQTKAYVDLMLLRSTLRSTDTAVGEWVNVMGYVTKGPGYQETSRQAAKSNLIMNKAQPTSFTEAPKAFKDDNVSPKAYLQAIVLWSAKGIKLQDYEMTMAKALADFKSS